MARKTPRTSIHPLSMAEALTVLNERIGAVIMAAGAAAELKDTATESQLRLLIAKTDDAAKDLRSAAWPDDDQ